VKELGFVFLGGRLLPEQESNPSRHADTGFRQKQNRNCKIWGFDGGDSEEWRLLGCYAVWLTRATRHSSKPIFRKRFVAYQSQPSRPHVTVWQTHRSCFCGNLQQEGFSCDQRELLPRRCPVAFLWWRTDKRHYLKKTHLQRRFSSNVSLSSLKHVPAILSWYLGGRRTRNLVMQHVRYDPTSGIPEMRTLVGPRRR
jgi:hypothetical protein